MRFYILPEAGAPGDYCHIPIQYGKRCMGIIAHGQKRVSGRESTIPYVPRLDSKQGDIAGSIDSQVSKQPPWRVIRGFDAGKKIQGRKRHILGCHLA